MSQPIVLTLLLVAATAIVLFAAFHNNSGRSDTLQPVQLEFSTEHVEALQKELTTQKTAVGARKKNLEQTLANLNSELLTIQREAKVAFQKKEAADIHQTKIQGDLSGVGTTLNELRKIKILPNSLPSYISLPVTQLGSALYGSISWDIGTVLKQKSLFPFISNVILIRTNDASERVLTTIALLGGNILSRGGVLHVMYFGDDEKDIKRLQFAASASLAAVHVVPPKAIGMRLSAYQSFIDAHALICKYSDSCTTPALSKDVLISPQDLWNHHRYLAEALFLVGADFIAPQTAVWSIDNDIQFVGDFGNLLGKTYGLSKDLLVAYGDGAYGSIGKRSSTETKEWNRIGEWVPTEKRVKSLNGVKRMRVPFMQLFYSELFEHQHFASDDLIFGSICSNAPRKSCKFDKLPTATFGTTDMTERFDSEFDSKPNWITCLEDRQAAFWMACGDDRVVALQSISKQCANLLDKFIKTGKASLQTKEIVLFDDYLGSQRCQPYKGIAQISPTVLRGPSHAPFYSDNTSPASDNDTSPFQLMEFTSVPSGSRYNIQSVSSKYHGRTGGWYLSMQQHTKGAFKIWDKDTISRQFTLVPKPEHVVVVRVQKQVTRRVAVHVRNIAMSLLRDESHMHVLYQGNSLSEYQNLRTQFSHLNVAVHYFELSFAVDMVSNDNAALYKLATRVCPNLDANCDQTTYGSELLHYLRFGKLSKSPSWLLEMFPSLPEIVFLARYGPVPPSAMYWSMNSDVQYLGNFKNFLVAAKQKFPNVDLLLPASSRDSFGVLKHDTDWGFADYLHPAYEKQFRSLASIKRMSGELAANAVQAVLQQGMIAIDELLFGSLCLKFKDCKAGTLLDLEHGFDKKAFRTDEYPDNQGTWDMLTASTSRGKLIQQVVHPFRTEEYVLLKDAFIPE